MLGACEFAPRDGQQIMFCVVRVWADLFALFDGGEDFQSYHKVASCFVLSNTFQCALPVRTTQVKAIVFVDLCLRVQLSNPCSPMSFAHPC